MESSDFTNPQFASALAQRNKTNRASAVSRNGPGWSWVTETVKEQPWLFGSGGWQDGFTALIQTSNNIQKEEDLTMQHMGNRTVDESIIKRNIANSNLEFNFSQFKTGLFPEGTQNNPGKDASMPGYTMIPLTTLNGVVAGDTAIKLDPRGDDTEVLAATLGIIAQEIYSEKGDSGIDNVSGKGVKTHNHSRVGNPFTNKPAKSAMSGIDTEMYDKPMTMTEEEQGGGGAGGNQFDNQAENQRQDSYFREDKYSEEQQKVYTKMQATGLRRVNVANRRESREPLAAEQQKHTYETLNEMNRRQEQFMNMLTPSEREITIERSRYPGSKYSSNQMGLNSLSSKMYKRSQRHRKQNNGKISSTLVGV